MLFNDARAFGPAVGKSHDDEDRVGRDEQEGDELYLRKRLWPAIEKWERRRDGNNEPGQRQDEKQSSLRPSDALPDDPASTMYNLQELSHASH